MPLIEEIDIDEVFSESQRNELWKSNKRQKTVGSCHSEMTKGSESTDDEQSTARVSATSAVQISNADREIVRE